MDAGTDVLPAFRVMAMVDSCTASLKVAETAVVTGTPVAPEARAAGR